MSVISGDAESLSKMYVKWLLMQLGYVFFVLIILDEIELFNKYFNHSILWMCMLSAFYREYDIKVGILVLTGTFLTTYFEIFDRAHILVFEYILDLDYHRPQDGVVFAASTVLLWSLYRHFIAKCLITVYSTASLILILAFWAFNLLVHFVFVGSVLPEMTMARIEANKNVVTMDGPRFLGLCSTKGVRGAEFSDQYALPSWICYSGEVGSTLPRDFSSIEGVSSIHEYSSENGGKAWSGWTSNFNDRATIDSPLKHVAYYADGEHYNVLIDYVGFWADKNTIKTGIYYFFAVFGVSWYWIGILLVLVHQNRFRGRGPKDEVSLNRV